MVTKTKKRIIANVFSLHTHDNYMPNASDSFCEVCGIRLNKTKEIDTWDCGACGQMVSTDAKFCSHCGMEFDFTAKEER
jgi:ribosomal protein L37AE/L43A